MAETVDLKEVQFNGFNRFFSQSSLLISLKISENLCFTDIFWGIQKEHWEKKD